MSRTTKIIQAHYKCLAKNCEIKLETKYLFCGIECACYAGFYTWHKNSFLRWLQIARNHIIYRIIVSSRIVHEYFRP